MTITLKSAADIEGMQRAGLEQRHEPELLLVERAGALEIIDIERGLDDAVEAGHGALLRLCRAAPMRPARRRRRD
jgi:hypothetical protein